MDFDNLIPPDVIPRWLFVAIFVLFTLAGAAIVVVVGIVTTFLGGG